MSPDISMSSSAQDDLQEELQSRLTRMDLGSPLSSPSLASTDDQDSGMSPSAIQQAMHELRLSFELKPVDENSQDDKLRSLAPSPISQAIAELHSSIQLRLAHQGSETSSSGGSDPPPSKPSSSSSSPDSPDDYLESARSQLDEEGEGQLNLNPPISPLDIYMLNPLRWAWTFEGTLLGAFNSLKTPNWVDSAVLDLWLLHHWIALGRPPFRYIPFEFLRDEVTPASIVKFRRLFGITETAPATTSPAAAFIHVGGNHYCCMVFVPQDEEVHVLGRVISEGTQRKKDPPWDLWSGDVFYDRAAELHGWRLKADEVDVYELNWDQNGYDCGPIAAQVLDHIWTNRNVAKDSRLFWKKPRLPCAHGIRMEMGEAIHTIVLSNIEKFHDLELSYPHEQLGDLFGDESHDFTREELLEMVGDAEGYLHPNPGAQMEELVKNILGAKEQCAACGRTVTRPRQVGQSKKDSKHEKGIKVMGDEDDGDPSEVPAIANKEIHVKDWSQADMKRFARPVDPPELPAQESLRGLWLPFNPRYDEYEGAPLSETLQPIHDTILQFSEINVAYTADRAILSPWTTFIDYGYRLHANFVQTYHLHKPVMLREHLMPVGIRHNHQPPSFDVEDRFGNPISVDDVKVMGASEMLRDASTEGSTEVFVKGKTRDGKFICVDLEKDKRSPLGVGAHVDIDSLIWVTRSPRFKKSVGIYQRPVIRPRAPIYKHNHVYVDLVYPQSLDDAAKGGGRTEWDPRRFKLSQMPHVLLGKLADSAGSCNLLMAFPRMAHLLPHINRWANNVPSHVQGVLWSQIIIPAMREVVSDVESLYAALDLDHSSFKDQDQGSKLPPTYPFKAEAFQKLVTAFQAKIVKGAGKLNHFGSFFFILEVKGCKNLTRAQVTVRQEGDMVLGTCATVLEHLHSEFSSLDWKYMEERDNGELFCDLGITYHPSGVEEPLVGLWRLPSLEASYGAGGYLKGTLHNHNTLSLFGGLQAEMSTERCHRSHISFRSSYNLAYEATRLKSNSRSLFEEKEVHEVSSKFVASSGKVLEIFSKKADEKSYGVRDEFRMSYVALKECVGFLDDEIAETIRSDPILWLPSATWFKFLHARLNSLVETQSGLATRSTLPGNFGVMSGLFAYLMQSVLFTPLKVNSYVRESLALLRFDGSLGRYGMFFLHDLDLSRETEVLPGILKKDDMDVLRMLGVKAKPIRRFKPTKPAGRMREVVDPVNYPIGRTPSWKELTDRLKEHPWDIIRKVEAKEVIGDVLEGEKDSLEEKAAELFISWTKGVWSCLHQSWKVAAVEFIKVKSLEEAIEFWSVRSLHDHLNSYTVIPCNAGLAGSILGQRMQSFRERGGLYFRRGNEEPKWKEKWPELGERRGYLWKYEDVARRLDEKDLKAVVGMIERIFEICECLPSSNFKGKGFWEVKGNCVMVMGNPDQYRLDGIGNQVKQRGKRGAPAHGSGGKVKMALLRNDGMGEMEAKKQIWMDKEGKRGSKKGKSKAVLNKRKAPVRKRVGKVKEVLKESEREEEEEDEDEDEDDRSSGRGDEEEADDDDDADVSELPTDFTGSDVE